MIRAAVLAILLVSIGVPARAGTAISVTPRRPHPGEAFLVTVVPGSRVTEVTGQVFGKPLHFIARGRSFTALSGVDLFQAPGPQEMVLSVGQREIRRTLPVAKKKFGTERLTLPADKVDLDADALKRVEKEKRELDAIWPVDAPEKFWNGPFALPVTGGSFGSSFGVRRMINGEERSPHMGQDIKAPEGTPVHAFNAGRTVFVGEHFFSGKSVILDHGNGLYSMYFHLAEVRTGVGESVGREQIIGTVGATGRASGPHLHWGVRLQGMRVDPLSFISLKVPRD